MNNSNFEDCLKKGKIREFSRGKILVKKELESATLDLQAAEDSFKDKNYKWTTVQTYYSMFHSARALLYNKNYREKSHYCLIEALRTLYADEGFIGYWLIEALQKAKTLREGADYYSEFSEEGAEDLIKKSKEFINKTKEILNSTLK